MTERKMGDLKAGADEEPGNGASPPPGFYADPEGGQRWWDGSQWTEHRQDAAPPAAPVSPEPKPTGMEHRPDDGDVSTLGLFGWILAVLLPPAGLVIGIVMASREERGAVGVITISLVVMVALIAVSTSGGQ